jgi:mRNA interferase MazF
MVIKQGDIIKIDFNPTIGHEQAGFRPAIVISNKTFNLYTNLLIVLPITNTENDFPLHIPLDDRTQTTGCILCEHVKSIDKTARTIKRIEAVPHDILKHVIAMVYGEIDVES